MTESRQSVYEEVLVEALNEILRVHANDNQRPRAFYIASDALQKHHSAKLEAALQQQPIDVDRDDDGELLIDWWPSPTRMLTMALRADGRLSYAFHWDGEKAHGTAQMPAASPG